MNKRIYIGFINDYWIDNERYFHTEEFKVLFDKNEILNYCINIAKEKISKYSDRTNYHCEIIIHEYSSIRYIFEYPAGFMKYFDDNISKPSYDLYDKLLSCINYNKFEYDYNGDLIESHPCVIKPKNGNLGCSLDLPLFEEDCINGYKSEFKYYYNGKIQKCIKNYEYDKFSDIYLCSIYHEHEPYDINDSGISYSISTFDTLSDTKNHARYELLSDAGLYNDEVYNENKLLELIRNKFSNYRIDIYKISDHDCIKLYSITNIDDLKED